MSVEEEPVAYPRPTDEEYRRLMQEHAAKFLRSCPACGGSSGWAHGKAPLGGMIDVPEMGVAACRRCAHLLMFLWAEVKALAAESRAGR